MIQVGLDAGRVKAAIAWVDGVGAEYVQVRARNGKVKAHAAVFVHTEAVLAEAPVEDFSVYLESKALQRFAAKLRDADVTLEVGDTVVMRSGKTKATFAQPAVGRDCLDVVPAQVVRANLDPADAKLLVKYTAKDGKLSQVKLTATHAYAHDKVAALRVDASGRGYLSKRVLEWGSPGALYYASPTGSYVRQPDLGAVLYEAHTPDVNGWPEQIPQVFDTLEGFPVGFSLPVADVRRVLQAYGKLDVDQAIRISGDASGTAVVSIHGTKTVIEDGLAVEAEGDFTAVLAIATLVPFFTAAPDSVAHFRYAEDSPYLVAVDGWAARLLTPRGA